MIKKNNPSGITSKVCGIIVALMAPTVFTGCDETTWLDYYPYGTSSISVTVNIGSQTETYVIGANSTIDTTETYNGNEYEIWGTADTIDGDFTLEVYVYGPNVVNGSFRGFVSDVWGSGSS